VLFQPGSMYQLVLGLMICFVTFGMYAAFSPFEDSSDQLLSNIAQIHTFFAMAVTILINAYPNNLFIDYLLSGLMFMPVILAFLLESDLDSELKGGHAWFAYKKDGSDSPWWAAVWKSAYAVHRTFDRLIGAARPLDEMVGNAEEDDTKDVKATSSTTDALNDEDPPAIKINYEDVQVIETINTPDNGNGTGLLRGIARRMSREHRISKEYVPIEEDEVKRSSSDAGSRRAGRNSKEITGPRRKARMSRDSKEYMAPLNEAPDGHLPEDTLPGKGTFHI